MRSSNLIHLLGAAHEGGKFGVEARRVFEEGRVADPLIDRELGAGDHLRGVFGGDQVRVLVLSSAPCVTSTGSFRLRSMSSTSSGRLLKPRRTLGGTIMLKASMVSYSSWVGWMEKQPYRKSRVAAMLVARSSDAMSGRLLRTFGPMKVGSPFW